jgi:hypothetical protein
MPPPPKTITRHNFAFLSAFEFENLLLERENLINTAIRTSDLKLTRYTKIQNLDVEMNFEPHKAEN